MRSRVLARAGRVESAVCGVLARTQTLWTFPSTLHLRGLGDHTQVDSKLPTVRLAARRFREGDLISGKALVAERVHFPVKKCKSANYERFFAGRVETQHLDDSVAIRIVQGRNPDTRP